MTIIWIYIFTREECHNGSRICTKALKYLIIILRRAVLSCAATVVDETETHF